MLRDEPENGEKETGKSRFPVFVSPEAQSAYDRLIAEYYPAARQTKMQTAQQKMVPAAMPPMTGEEIEVEIKSYRAERCRAARA